MKRPTKTASCDGKYRHRNKNDAMYARFLVMKERGATNLIAYKCRFCNSWHVGHPPKSRKRIKR